MAEAAHTTITRIPHSGDARIGMTAREWEGDICDLRDLSLVTATIADAALSATTPKPTASEVRQLFFCIYEMSKRIDLFCDAYYLAIEAK